MPIIKENEIRDQSAEKVVLHLTEMIQNSLESREIVLSAFFNILGALDNTDVL